MARWQPDVDHPWPDRGRDQNIRGAGRNQT
jgi:hypothetical protein